jgi:hypothetical protein
MWWYCCQCHVESGFIAGVEVEGEPICGHNISPSTAQRDQHDKRGQFRVQHELTSVAQLSLGGMIALMLCGGRLDVARGATGLENHHS